MSIVAHLAAISYGSIHQFHWPQQLGKPGIRWTPCHRPKTIRALHTYRLWQFIGSNRKTSMFFEDNDYGWRKIDHVKEKLRKWSQSQNCYQNDNAGINMEVTLWASATWSIDFNLYWKTQNLSSLLKNSIIIIIDKRRRSFADGCKAKIVNRMIMMSLWWD